MYTIQCLLLIGSEKGLSVQLKYIVHLITLSDIKQHTIIEG